MEALNFDSETLLRSCAGQRSSHLANKVHQGEGWTNVNSRLTQRVDKNPSLPAGSNDRLRCVRALRSID
jgi:hypothetical protein